MVPSAGRRFKTSIRIAYDFATLNRILGMSSDTNLSIMGRIDFSITSKLIAGASVCDNKKVILASAEPVQPCCDAEEASPK